MASKVDSDFTAIDATPSADVDKAIKANSNDKDLDVGAELANYLADEGYTAEEERSLRWKMDLRIIPILWLNICMGAMDKVSTSTAALYGMIPDTGLTGNRYSWVGSSFYFGYLFWCLPAGQMLQRLPIAKTMCGVQLLWGVIVMCTGLSRNFATLIALRVLLGALEAPVVPGNFLILGMWYPRREQPPRTALMYNGMSVMFSGPIGYAIGHVENTDLAWRLFFFISGAMTLVWAIVVGVFLPDNPVKAKFISHRQKAIAVERMRADQTGIENKQFKWDQVRDTLKDPKTWLMVLFNLWVSIPNGGLTNFMPLIINGLGFTPQISCLMTIPAGLMQTVSSFACNYGIYFLSKKYPTKNFRGLITITGLLVGMISSIFLYTLPLDAYYNRLVSVWFGFFYLGPYVVSLGLNIANTAGHTKKVTTNALIFIAYCVSNILGPQFFKAEQAPLYPLGIGAILVSYVLAIITMAFYMGYCIYENRRRDRMETPGAGSRAHLDTDFRDITDQENVHFRYVW